MFARFSRHQQKLPDWGIIEAGLRLQQRDFLAERPIGKAKRMIEQWETEQFCLSVGTAPRRCLAAMMSVHECASTVVVLVVATPPDARLVAALGRAVKPLEQEVVNEELR